MAYVVTAPLFWVKFKGPLRSPEVNCEKFRTQHLKKDNFEG